MQRFDENENGEETTTIDKIDRLAFDKTYLLIDRRVTVSYTHLDVYKRQEQTREKLIRAFKMLENKADKLPKKKHGNIPL